MFNGHLKEAISTKNITMNYYIFSEKHVLATTKASWIFSPTYKIFKNLVIRTPRLRHPTVITNYYCTANASLSVKCVRGVFLGTHQSWAL